MGAGRLRGSLCSCDGRFRSRRDFRIGRRCLVRPVWGSLWNFTGATLGATLAFLVARYIAGGWVERKAGGLLKRLIEGVDAEGWRFVAFVRLVPLFPFNLSNYVLGLTRIPLHHYVIATFVCMAPGAVAYTWLGHAGRGALAGETDAVRYGLLALGLLAAIALLPRLIGRIRKSFTWIEVDELKRRLEGGEAMTIIDVRGTDEFTGPLGHVATARNIPVAELNGRLAELAGLERTPIVLVCRTDKRSAAAAQTLRSAGFPAGQCSASGDGAMEPCRPAGARPHRGCSLKEAREKFIVISCASRSVLPRRQSCL